MGKKKVIAFVELCPYKFQGTARVYGERLALRFCINKSKLKSRKKTKIKFIRLMDEYKWRPKKSDVEPYLDKLQGKINAVKPDLIVFLGKDVARFVCHIQKMGKYRGWWNIGNLDLGLDLDVPYIITWAGDELMADWRRCYDTIMDFDAVAGALDFGISYGNPENLMRRGQYVICDTPKKVKEALRECEAAGKVALDTETTGFKFWLRDILCISLSPSPGRAFVIPWNQNIDPENMTETKRCNPFWSVKDKKRVRTLLNKFFKGHINFFGQNLKFDLLFLRKEGWRPSNIIWDTLSAARLLNENRPANLNYLCQQYNVGFGKYDEEIYEYVNPDSPDANYGTIPNDELWLYSCVDADVTHRIALEQMDEMDDFPKLKKLLLEVQIPMSAIFEEVEYHGVRIHRKRMEKMASDYEKAAIEADKKLREAIARHPACRDLEPTEFNINSPKDMRGLLFERLQLPLIEERTTGEAYGSDILQKLEGAAPKKREKRMVSLIRRAKKCRAIHDRITGSRYRGGKSDGYAGYIDKRGFAHTAYQLDYVVSGRLSSRGINLQNVENAWNLPLFDKTRDEEGKRQKTPTFGMLFIPHRKGNILLSKDYSQVEIRVAAVLSGDQELLREVNENLDIHTRNARMFWDIPDEEEVTSKQRSDAKPVSFGAQYGGEEKVVQKATGCSREEARRLLDLYWGKYSQLKRWRENKVKVAKHQGYIQTYLFGRRRNVGMAFGLYGYLLKSLRGPATKVTRKWIYHLRLHVERQIYNFPVQSFVADLMNTRIIKCHEYLKTIPHSRIILQVHDEISIDTPEETVKEVDAKLTKLMGWRGLTTPIKSVKKKKGAYKTVDLTTDSKTGKFWNH